MKNAKFQSYPIGSNVLCAWSVSHISQAPFSFSFFKTKNIVLQYFLIFKTPWHQIPFEADYVSTRSLVKQGLYGCKSEFDDFGFFMSQLVQ